MNPVTMVAVKDVFMAVLAVLALGCLLCFFLGGREFCLVMFAFVITVGGDRGLSGRERPNCILGWLRQCLRSSLRFITVGVDNGKPFSNASVVINH